MDRSIQHEAYGDLCGGLDIREEYGLAYRYRSRKTGLMISMRPVCLPLDEELVAACAVHEWTREGYPMQWGRERFIEAKNLELEAIAASTMGQTFLGMIGDKPVFLAGIRKSLQDQVSQAYPAREEDYLFYLEIPPDDAGVVAEEVALAILQACLAHFFSYSQVKMVIARINKDNLQENEWYEMGGFRFLQELGPSQESLRLHYHTGLGYLDK